MIKRIILLSLLCSCSSLFGAVSNLDFSLDNSYPQNIVINNRILLKVNGKSITVMDVVRKMDLLFYRQYPETCFFDHGPATSFIWQCGERC